MQDSAEVPGGKESATFETEKAFAEIHGEAVPCGCIVGNLPRDNPSSGEVSFSCYCLYFNLVLTFRLAFLVLYCCE